MKRALLIILLAIIPCILFAQKKSKKEKKQVEMEEIEKPDINLNLEKADSIPDVPLKEKKNVYYGEKTKRQWTVAEVQGRTQIEEFYVLKEPVEVNPYIPFIGVYDRDKDEIVNLRNRSGLVENVLHGPYKRMVNEKVVEEGMFFFGAKHERWMMLSLQQKLNDKEHYFKGWYRDSEITYYDPDKKTKVKEVIPFQYGKREGMYYLFYENGQLAVRGLYEFDKRVGIWEEFHNNTRTTILKRQIQFTPDPYSKSFRPYILRESDRFANIIYESPKVK